MTRETRLVWLSLLLALVVAALGRADAWQEADEFEAEIQEQIKDYTSQIKRNPNDPDLYYQRAILLTDLEDYDRAVADLTQALKLSPDDTDYLEARGDALMYQEKYDPALKDYTRIIELSPSEFHPYWMRGYCYETVGKFDLAIQDYTKAIELGDTDYNSRGWVYFSQGDYEKALADANQTCRNNIRDYYAYSFRGMVHDALGNSEAAMNDAQMAIFLEKEDPFVWIDRGLQWLRKQQPEKALEDFDRAIELDDSLGFFHGYRARALGRLGRWSEAHEAARKAVESEDPIADDWSDLAWVEAVATDDSVRNAAEALKHARRAVELAEAKPHEHAKIYQAEFHANLAIALAVNGKFDEAVAAQKKAIELAAPIDQEEFKKRLALFEAKQVYRLPEPKQDG